MDKKMIEIRGLYKSYKARPVLKNLSLEVEQGEIYGFLGPNGVGKSTTVHLLTKILEPDNGSIFINGKRINDYGNELYQKIGIVGEHQNLYENLTIKENLDYFASLFKLPLSRVLEILNELDLEQYANVIAKNLSKGLKQRVLIARAILHQPKILFLDEPSSGLDPIASDKIMKNIKNLANNGITVFLTSHFLEEVNELCHRIGFLRDGRIVEEGPIPELIQRHQTRNLKDLFLKIYE